MKESFSKIGLAAAFKSKSLYRKAKVELSGRHSGTTVVFTQRGYPPSVYVKTRPGHIHTVIDGIMLHFAKGVKG